MGKKKIVGAQKNQAKAAPLPKPPDTEPAQTDWFSNLTPEEQEREVEKRKERERKALAAKKRDDESRQWREQQEGWQAKADRKTARAAAKQDKEFLRVLDRALNEDVVVAEEHVDGLWYVEVEKGTWKEVDDSYWCKHCKASLNEATLESHLNGARHQKCFGASGGCPTSSVAPAAPVVAAGDASGLEVWQEYDGSQCIRCKACNKVCDDWHVASAEHERRLQSFLWDLRADDASYAAPAEQWLAWVSDASTGSRRYLKCLLCDKWIQDLVGDSTEEYVGHHGRLGQYNQKDHRRKLEHLSYYLPDLAGEKKKWHPPAPAAGSRSERPAGARPPAAATVPDPPDLPEGWRAAWCPEQASYYFWSAGTGPSKTQWQVPTAPSQPSAQPPAEERAPRPAPAETEEDETEEC